MSRKPSGYVGDGIYWASFSGVFLYVYNVGQPPQIALCYWVLPTGHRQYTPVLESQLGHLNSVFLQGITPRDEFLDSHPELFI